MPKDSTVFVDTNVFLYSFDDRDVVKQEAAKKWLACCWSMRLGRLSSQVVNEFYANALTKFSRVLPYQKARAEIRRLRTWQIWQIDDATVDAAWSLQDRFTLSYWDALMLAAAQQMGCAYLLTEDLQHEQRFDNLQVINPFVTGVELLEKIK